MKGKCGLLARGQFNVIPTHRGRAFGVLWAAHEAKYTDILIAEGLGKLKARGLARRLNCILKFERVKAAEAMETLLKIKEHLRK